MRHLSPPVDFITSQCLTDKNILVTGAGDGIGYAAALAFAQQGATVILLGRTKAKLEAAYDDIVATGAPEPVILPFNLEYAQPADYEKICDAIDNELGALHGILHNAALLGDRTTIANYNPETWQAVLQVNLHAPFLLTRALMPLLRKPETASVLFTSSSVGRNGRAYWGAYSVSKAGIENLAQVLNSELEHICNIRVNTINPGATRTAMRAQAYPGENPGSVTPPAELMPLYLYLMSDASRTVHGRSIDAQIKKITPPSKVGIQTNA